MHYNAVFLAIFTLFAAGTVSASAFPQAPKCVATGNICVVRIGFPCCDPNGIVQYICVSVVSILMLLYHCQPPALPTTARLNDPK